MEVKLFVMVDSAENYVVCADDDDLDTLFNNEQGAPKHPTRVLEITLDVPLPSYVQLSAKVPEEEVEEITMKVE